MRDYAGGAAGRGDTIAAIATPPGEGGIGIVRLSGPEAFAIADKVFRGRTRLVLAPTHTVHYGRIVDPRTEEVLDEVLVLVLRAPRTFTREDVVEIQGHGGFFVLRAVLRAVLAAGARLAEPGEFTLRAFLHGRLDLAQAEAVLDLIRARTEYARRFALRQLAGDVSQAVRGLFEEAQALRAQVEFELDFSEHDEGEIDRGEFLQRLEVLRRRVGDLLRGKSVARLVREGPAVVLTGRPNVGKSSLLNALLREERAIVTPIPGTTRDVVAGELELAGFRFRLLDTAGLRTTEDPVESIGVARARKALREADLVLLVVDGSSPLTEEDVEIARYVASLSVPAIVVVNKADLAPRLERQRAAELVPGSPVVSVSAATGEGLGELEERLRLAFVEGEAWEGVLLVNERHLRLAEEAEAALAEAEEAMRRGATLGLVALPLRVAAERLGAILGIDVGEDLVRQIFSRFCVGK